MPRILVVDDEEQIQKMLRAILIRAGHEVHTAGNAETAIHLCAQQDCFDLIISDVVMPGMDGHELARRVSVRCPRSRLLLMSGFDPGCEECPYLHGCQQLRKPFVPEEVTALIASALAQPVLPHRLGGLSKQE